MVCVPCFLIPIILWVFHKFIQPWLSKIWGNSENYVTSNLTCPLPKKTKKPVNSPETKDGETSKESVEENGQDTNVANHVKAE